MGKTLKALLIVVVLTIVVFVGVRLTIRRDEIALIATSLTIYVVWEYFEAKQWIHDEFGCASYALPILLPIIVWLIFKSYVAPALGF